jgi:hypothetical protein
VQRSETQHLEALCGVLGCALLHPTYGLTVLGGLSYDCANRSDFTGCIGGHCGI